MWVAFVLPYRVYMIISSAVEIPRDVLDIAKRIHFMFYGWSGIIRSVIMGKGKLDEKSFD